MSESPLQAGTSSGVITPELPVYLAGYGDRHDPAVGINDDLEVHALVLDDGATRLALLTFDLLGMTPDVSQPIREAVATELDISPAHVITACTHVHAGPSTLTGSDAIGWPVPDGYPQRLAAVAPNVAREAFDARAPVSTSFARVDLPAAAAMNRRGHPLASSAAVLALRDTENGNPRVVVANFGIHPTITGPSNLHVATDWVGPFRRTLSAATGAHAMFLQGCQGDVNPAVTEWESGAPADWGPVVRNFAVPLADVIDNAVAGASPIESAPLYARERTVRVPIGDTLLAQLAGRAKERAVRIVEWRLGDVALAGVPGEGFHGVEQALRAAHPDPLMLAGLAPEWHGYLPRPYGEGYEESLSLGPAAVDQIVTAISASQIA